MAEKHNGRPRRTRDRLLVLVTAVAMSGALVLGHTTHTTVIDAMVSLTNTVIGAGGRGDTLGERVQQKLSATVQPASYRYEGVRYPANYDLAGSRDVGVSAMHLALAAHSSDEHLIVAGYSAGTLVAERVRRDLQARGVDDAPSADQLTFTMIASPFAPNGGIYSRFPGLFIPFIIDAMVPSAPTRYDTTYHAIEYDAFSDFPAYFNPLAILNSALSLRYGHPDAYYDVLDPATTPHLEKEVVNSEGGTDTYILYRNPHLPLLAPIRELAAALQVTRFTEPLLGAIEPLLRLVVDMGYTDRTYANADVHTRFSFFTPPHKIIEALLAVPDALREGLTNLVSGGQITETQAPLAARHKTDLDTSRTAEDSEPETVVAEADTEDAVDTEDATDTADQEPEITEPSITQPSITDSRKPTLTSDGNKVTPIGAVGGPATTTGADPVTEPEPTKTKTDTKTKTKTDPKTDPDDATVSAPEPDSQPEQEPEKDRTEAAA